MTLRHAWLLPLTPTAAVLLIAVALIPATGEHNAWLLAVLLTAVVLAAAVATAAGRVSGNATERPRTIAIVTGALTAATPFAVSGLLGGPMHAVIAVPWLIFGLGAAYWQLELCEGARSRPLHAAIGFSYTFVFTAATLFFAVASAQLVD